MPVNSPTMLKAMIALVPTGARLSEAITEVHWPARYQPFSTNSKNVDDDSCDDAADDHAAKIDLAHVLPLPRRP